MARLIPILGLFVPFMLFSGASGAAEQEIDHARQYQACMDLVIQDPEAAFESATAWAGLGGGDAAEHCTGAAMVALGFHREGADRLEELAHRIRRDESFKARLLEQSAQASLMGGDTDRARAVLTAAITLTPDDPDLYIARGRALAEAGGLNETLADLDHALDLDPVHVDALVFKGAAHRLLGDLVAADTALVSALALDPDHPEGLLERGMVKRLMGDDQGARIDWLQAALNAPGTGIARAARRNIELMELGE